MPNEEIAMDRHESDVSVDTHNSISENPQTPVNSRDQKSSNHVETDANDPEMTPQRPDKVALPSPSNVSTPTNDRKRKQEPSEEPTDDADECVRQFSRAQLRVHVKRARLEANIAVQDDIKALRFALLHAEQTAQAYERQKQQADQRYDALQQSMDTIVHLHQRTLHGMRDHLPLEQLVASLDKEKGSKEALREAYQEQNAELLRAQQRIASLDAQIVQYQKTETVLAQSISHFQDQFASKDFDKAAAVERLKRELETQHCETRSALQADVARLVQDRDALQVQLQQLKADHVGLQETAQAVIEMQEVRDAEQQQLRVRVAQLETDNAVLASKVDTVQTHDAHLRSTILALETQLLTLKQDAARLQKENTELSAIASDLMDMAEQQHAHTQQTLPTSDTKEDGETRLARTRTRLRESLG